MLVVEEWALLQNNLLIAYASKALTKTQRSWAQIEKELYAIVFGCERFHYYIFGQIVEIESDHKPLIPILRRPLDDSPVRLQKMRLRLQPYDITVNYRPGKELYLADMLSRLPMNDSIVVDDTDLELRVLLIDCKDDMSENSLKEFKLETRADEELQCVLNLVRYVWPAHK